MLIVGVGSGLVAAWQPTITDARLEDAFAILAASVVYVAVTWQVPAFASVMITGMPALGLGSATASLTSAASGAAILAGTGGAAAEAALRGASTVGAAASFGSASARASGGGLFTAAKRGAGALVGEAQRTMGNSLSSKFFSATGQGIRQRKALLVGQAVPPPGGSGGAPRSVAPTVDNPSDK